MLINRIESCSHPLGCLLHCLPSIALLKPLGKIVEASLLFALQLLDALTQLLQLFGDLDQLLAAPLVHADSISLLLSCLSASASSNPITNSLATRDRKSVV